MVSRDLKANFVAALRKLLRPVVRQMISYGVSYSAFDRIVRELFVEVAEEDFALPFKRQTDSRLSLMTGLNRKEIAQLRQRRAQPEQTQSIEDSLITHVMGRWMGGPPYAAPDGTPRRLPYESTDKRLASFARLARDVVGVDIPVRSVLDELLRTGAVQLDSEGNVELSRQAYVPPDGTEGKLTLLGSDPAELFSTIVYNIEHPENARLQRKVVYDNVGSDALPALKEEARRLGEEFIRRSNALLASYDRDRNPEAPGGKRSRVALATFYFEQETPSPEAPPASSEPPHPPGRIRRKR